MKRVKKNLVIVLLLTTIIVFLLNCGSGSGGNSVGDSSTDRGSLKIDLNFPVNVSENQKKQKLFTWENIVSDNIPEPSELNYRIEVVSQDLTSSYEFFASYDFLNDESTALVDMEPGNVTVYVEAYMPDDDSLEDMMYYGSNNVVIVSGYKVTLEILLNEVSSDESYSPGVDVDIEINNNPIIDSVMVSSLFVEESESFTYSVVAHDPDGDSLYYSWKLDGEQICSNPEGCNSTLPENVYPGEHLFSIKVTAGRGGSTTVDFQLTVYSNDAQALPSPFLFPLLPL